MKSKVSFDSTIAIVNKRMYNLFKNWLEEI